VFQRFQAPLAGLLLALASAPAAAGDVGARDPRAGAIGLLQLPEVYGTEPCQRFQPTPVKVYGEPRAGRALGEIRVARYWTFPPEGGCEGLRVEFVPASGASGEMPAQEFAAEQPAAIVLEQRAAWFRVRLPQGSGWVRATPRNDFGPLLALLQRDVDGFTDPAGATLRRTPADDAELVWRGVPTCAVPRVRAADQSGPRAWLEVEFERDACCADEAAMAPAAPVRGWLPLYRADGVPSLWFAPRGC
jgi:hypothetical protein